MSDCFRINAPHVVAETLNGEATIVNLDSGTYYALNASGSLIWDELLSGATQANAASRLVQTYSIEPDQAADAVTSLVEELREQDLLVPANGNGSGPAAATPENENGSRGEYLRPELSSYTDMQELLLLDPIHEVDEAGWPNRPF